MLRIRPVQLPDDLARIVCLDTTFTTDRIYRLERSDWSFALVETEVVPAVRKSFPLAEELHDLGADWDYAIVAEQDTTIAGFAAVKLERWNRRANLAHLYVAPDHRGQGLGRALLQNVLAYARAQGARCLWLEVTNVNYPAIQFYRRAGLQLCGWDETLYDPAGPAGGEFALFFAHSWASPPDDRNALSG